jgi:hypothetical protein
MTDFAQYRPLAINAANQSGVDPQVFLGLIQVESGWRANAAASTSSAYGFTQLLKGTAAGLGVDRFDPVQNLQGGAKYLGDLLGRFNGDYRTALAAYHDGPGAVGKFGGYDYADKVLATAKKFDLGAETNSFLGRINETLKSFFPGMEANKAELDKEGGATGLGLLPDFDAWFKRIAFAFLALLILAAALFMLKPNALPGIPAAK